MAKTPRLTERLSLALSKASAAASVGKAHPDAAAKCFAEVEKAVDEAMEILNAISRAASSI